MTATSSVNGGVLWTDYSEHPISASSDQPIIAISGEPLPPLPTYQAHYRPQHLQGPVGEFTALALHQFTRTGK